VLVGVGDLDTGTVTVANAGHLNPLVVAGGSATVATTAVGLPLGVAPSTYATTTIQLGDGDALVAFTDGLVERRGETIDSGVDRVVQAAPPSGSSVDDLLDALTGTVGDSGPADDIAILVIRWWDPESPLRSATITASTGGLA
jgi:serine phosphatase RsbU (regulator of sigma subunit)